MSRLDGDVVSRLDGDVVSRLDGDVVSRLDGDVESRLDGDVLRLNGVDNDAGWEGSGADLEVLKNVVEEVVWAWDLVLDDSERSCALIRPSEDVP